MEVISPFFSTETFWSSPEGAPTWNQRFYGTGVTLLSVRGAEVEHKLDTGYQRTSPRQTRGITPSEMSRANLCPLQSSLSLVSEDLKERGLRIFLCLKWFSSDLSHNPLVSFHHPPEIHTYDYLEIDEDLIIDLPFSLSKVTLLFHPEIAKCNVNHHVRPRVLVRDGVLVLEEKQTYEKRLKMSHYQIVLEEFQIADIGSYHVHDPQGNLATTVEVEIISEFYLSLFSCLWLQSYIFRI